MNKPSLRLNGEIINAKFKYFKFSSIKHKENNQIGNIWELKM